MKIKNMMTAMVIASVALVVLGVASAAYIFRQDGNNKRAKFRTTAVGLAQAEYGCTDVKVMEAKDHLHRLDVCGKTRWYRCRRSWNQEISCKEVKRKR